MLLISEKSSVLFLRQLKDRSGHETTYSIKEICVIVNEVTKDASSFPAA